MLEAVENGNNSAAKMPNLVGHDGGAIGPS